MRSRITLVAVASAAVLGVGACTPEAPSQDAALTPLGPVGEAGSGEPRLTSTPDGSAVLSWIQPRDGAEALQYAVLRDGAWTAPVTVVERDDLFVNWADLPSVAQLGDGRWVAHFLVLDPGAYASYDVRYATSADGRTWSEPQPLNTDTAEAEHGFATLFDWDGQTGAVWLDGRRVAAAANEAVGADGEIAGVELRFARLDADGEVVERGIVDELACDCCKTDVAATASGPVLAYRDRTPDEIRDVVVRRLEGGAWSAPQRVGDDGWRIEGCPVNGPAVDAIGDAVAVAWFTGAGGAPRVQLAWSADAGRSFAPAIEVDADGSFGQADVALLDADSAVVSWWRRSDGEGTMLAARRVERDGTLGPVREIASSDLGQPLDVPQLQRAGDGMVFAWTAFGDSLRVRTVYAEQAYWKLDMP